jgi:hypothetical protein
MGWSTHEKRQTQEREVAMGGGTLTRTDSTAAGKQGTTVDLARQNRDSDSDSDSDWTPRPDDVLESRSM